MSDLKSRIVALKKARPSRLEWRQAPIHYWRASAGARLMDKHAPGWYLKINLERLNFYHNGDCIIGQAIGDYALYGKTVLGVDPTSFVNFCRFASRSIRNGFFVGLVATFCDGDHKLKQAWTYQINKRLAAAA